jgi:hypothetical protein
MKLTFVDTAVNEIYKWTMLTHTRYQISGGGNFQGSPFKINLAQARSASAAFIALGWDTTEFPGSCLTIKTAFVESYNAASLSEPEPSIFHGRPGSWLQNQISPKSKN